jgi:hypothetical protein
LLEQNISKAGTMKKNLLFLLLCIFLAFNSPAQAPTFLWTKSLGSNYVDFGYSITTDASGNVYTTGGFFYTIDFNPGVGVYNLTSAGLWDIFITKLDSSGNFIWAREMGGSNDDAAQSIAVDDSGNVYTSGYFSGTVDFDPGAGVYNLTSAGSADMFILKLNSSGNFVWAKAMGGSGWDNAYSIASDASGNVYTTGVFQDTVDFDPGAAVVNVVSAGGSDIFISKLDAGGNFVWEKNIGGIDEESGSAIKVDGSGNIYITGAFRNGFDFDPGIGVYNMLSASGDNDAFILKLDAAGNFAWARRIGGIYSEWGHSVDVDNSGNVYTAGEFERTVDFDPGAGIFNLTAADPFYPDIFILKLNPTGDFVWAKAMGGTSSDIAYSIDIDTTGNVFTTGSFMNTVDFDPGAGVFNLTSAGSMDIFISKLDSSGNFMWAKGTGGTGEEKGWSLKLNAADNVFITGGFKSPTLIFNSDTLNNIGNHDVFIAKLSNVVPTCSASGSIVNNVTCFGGSDGSATVNSLTGTPPYTYAWQPSGQTVQTATNISAGTYTCNVTDSVGCNTSVTVTITQPSQLVASIPATWFACYLSPVCIYPAVSGGVPPYFYQWNNGDITDTTCVASSGVYVCIVYDSNGCTATATTTVTWLSQINSSFIITNSSCSTCNDGSAIITANGGAPPYAYSWSTPVQTSQTATGLLPGNYTCCITDANGCSACSSIAVNFCAVPSLQATNITFTNVTSNSVTVHWTNGDGVRRIVKIKPTHSFAPLVNGNDYTANSAYSGSGEQVVYNGTGNSATVTGLTSNAFYWFRVYEATCSANYSVYLNSVAMHNPRKVFTQSNVNRPGFEEDLDSEMDSFRIYPNPAHNTFTISLNELKVESGQLKIYDVTGRMVHEQTIRNQESEIRNLNLLPGIYLVKVEVGEKVWQQKLVVE